MILERERREREVMRERTGFSSIFLVLSSKRKNTVDFFTMTKKREMKETKRNETSDLSLSLSLFIYLFIYIYLCFQPYYIVHTLLYIDNLLRFIYLYCRRESRKIEFWAQFFLWGGRRGPNRVVCRVG